MRSRYLRAVDAITDWSPWIPVWGPAVLSFCAGVVLGALVV